VEERQTRQQHQAGMAADSNREPPEEQRARFKAQALCKKSLRKDESGAEESARLREEQTMLQNYLGKSENFKINESEKIKRCEPTIRLNIPNFF
jgi:hypothetical protein